MLRRIFAPKDDVRGGWRKLFNEELNNLHASPDIIEVMKSTRMRWEGHVASMGQEGCIQDFSGETCGKETTSKTQA